MANEGQFPKIDGDILYASEVNDFRRANRFFVIGSGVNVESGTGFQSLGSILIGAGSVSNPCQIIATAFFIHDINQVNQVTWRISGAQGNQSVTLGSTFLQSTQTLNAILGSPSQNMVSLRAVAGNGTGNTTTNYTIGSSRFNTGSSFVIEWLTTSGACSGLIWSVQAFRGTY